jgi:DNA-binding beta-propeller fold protein YncE
MRTTATFAIALVLGLFAQPALAAKLVLVAGRGTLAAEAPATECRLQAPFGIDFDRAGNAYLVEMTGLRVLRIDPAGRLTALAGTGRKGDTGDGGPARQAEFNGPHNLAVTPHGVVYVADTWNNRIRRIDPHTGVITTIAGTGKKGFSGDGGPATKAEFGGIYCVSLTPDGQRLLAADLDNRRVRAIDLSTGVVTTVAGNGKKGVPEDGAVAQEAPLVDPRAVAADHRGNVYVLERGGHALRVVGPDGRIRTVVGTGKAGFIGDGGDARRATLNGPKHLCVDRDGDVYIADTENHCVRKYLPREGRIVRVAGTVKKGTTGLGGPPEQAELNQPHGVTVRADGTLYIADSSNNRVLKIVP